MSADLQLGSVYVTRDLKHSFEGGRKIFGFCYEKKLNLLKLGMNLQINRQFDITLKKDLILPNIYFLYLEHVAQFCFND